MQLTSTMKYILKLIITHQLRLFPPGNVRTMRLIEYIGARSTRI